MSYTEIKSKIEELSHEWTEFKNKKEQKSRDGAQNQTLNAETESKLRRLNDSMNNCSDVLNRLEAASRRPVADVGGVSAECVSNSLEHKNAFINYVRRGNDAEIASFEQKSLSVDKDHDGGYLVTPQMATEINMKLKSSSAMRQLATVTEISSDGLEIIDDASDASAGWSLETTVRSDSKTPKLMKRFIKTHELYAQPKATQKLIDDAKVDVEAWLADKIADTFASLENEAFIHGDGDSKPFGFLNAAVDSDKDKGIKRLTSAIDGDSLIQFVTMLDSRYHENAKFLMNPTTLADIRSLKTKDGRYIWSPSESEGTLANKLFGFDVVLSPDMPQATKDQTCIAFGDFAKGYQIVDRSGITTLRDPFTQKPYIKFYTTKRVGGDVIDMDAIKLFRVG